MLIYTIIEYTKVFGIQGVKSFISKEICLDHIIYLNREFPECKFEVITSFSTDWLSADEVGYE